MARLILKSSIISSTLILYFILFASPVYGTTTAKNSNSEVNDASSSEDDILSPIIALAINYIKQCHHIIAPYFELLEQSTQPIYQEIKQNIWLNLVFFVGIILVSLRIVTSFLGSLCKTKKKYVYNREESMSFSDIKQHFERFSTELVNMKKQIDQLSKTGIVSNKETTGQTNIVSSNDSVSKEIKEEIAQITQNLTRSEDTIGKFLKEKKHVDNFLLEFQKEVVESHKTIWKELYSLRTILTASKTATPNASTPLGKPRTHDRTLSALQTSVELDRNSPNNLASKSIDASSKNDLIRQFGSNKPEAKAENISHAPIKSATQEELYKPQEEKSDEIRDQKQASVTDSTDLSTHNIGPGKTSNTSSDTTTDKPPENTDSSNRTREVSPFRPFTNPGVNLLGKGGPMGRNPPPVIRKTGPVSGANPFAKTNINPGTNSSQV